MANTAERRPVDRGGAPDDYRGDGNTCRVATPLRRRREAAWRLPLLDSGYCDPLGELAGLPITVQPCCRAMLGADGRWRQCCGRGAA
jgi:hypothetical protein